MCRIHRVARAKPHPFGLFLDMGAQGVRETTVSTQELTIRRTEVWKMFFRRSLVPRPALPFSHQKATLVSVSRRCPAPHGTIRRAPASHEQLPPWAKSTVVEPSSGVREKN